MINFNKYLTRKKAFVPFITAGDPSLDKTKEFIKALIEAGSTLIEIGIPFSDPIAEGKTIMTTEPKFVPSTGAKIKINEFSANIKMIDCVGYVIDDAKGVEDENGPRYVMTPWYSEPIPFVEAAEIGTEKVIKDHSTIGIVVTSDGSFGEFSRKDYVPA